MKRHHLIAGLLAMTAVLPASRADAACLQPIYVIAHRCNDPNDGPMTVADEGVNAIEADFSWGSRGFIDDTGHDNEWAVDHDGVLPHSTYLDNWLNDVSAEVARPGTTLSLVILDIKDPHGPLGALYDAVRSGLGPDINLLFSIPDYTQRHQFAQIKDRINSDPRAGVAIDYLDEADPAQIQTNVQSFFQDIGIPKYWYGDGLTAAFVTPDSVRTNIADGTALRDGESDCGAFHGVYTWTYETEGSFSEFIFDYGVNGIFVNTPACNGYASPATADDPELAIAFAKARAGRKFATPTDNPFEHVTPGIVCPGSAVVECSGPGGTSAADPQLASFFDGAHCPAGNCNAISITSDAPALFPVGATTDVAFTATDDSSCSPSSTCVTGVSVQDTIAPAITCPADIAVDPVSPQGTQVSFAATAADVCDPSAQAVCPDSGSTFGVGTVTVVTCTAADTSGNQQSCDLEVTVYSPQQVIANLQAAVDALAGSLSPGQANSLQAHLENILKSIDSDKQNPACVQLNSFIHKVEQLMDQGALTPAEGNPLLQSAHNLRGTLSC